MSVRAKFVCTRKLIQPSGQPEVNPEEAVLSFHPEYGPYDSDGNSISEENRIFGKWSPSGSITMTVRNPAAYDQFVQGKAYYIDFTPAE